MDLYKINYNKLQNINTTKLYRIVILVIIIFIFLLIKSNSLYVYDKYKTVGIFEKNKLYVNVNYEFENSVINGKFLKFNDKETRYKVIKFGDYENYNNTLMQNVELKLDAKFVNNEVGSVVFYYNRKTLLNYVFDLFKS